MGTASEHVQEGTGLQSRCQTDGDVRFTHRLRGRSAGPNEVAWEIPGCRDLIECKIGLESLLKVE